MRRGCGQERSQLLRGEHARRDFTKRRLAIRVGRILQPGMIALAQGAGAGGGSQNQPETVGQDGLAVEGESGSMLPSPQAASAIPTAVWPSGSGWTDGSTLRELAAIPGGRWS